MIHPSYVELMKVVNEDTALVGEEPVVNSRYSIVSATAKRARQIVSGDDPYIDHAENMKPLSIAVKELYDGKLKILSAEEVEEKEQELKEYKEKMSLKALEEAENKEAEASDGSSLEDAEVEDEDEEEAIPEEE